MIEKAARLSVRVALALLKRRIKFPRIRVKEILEAEDIISIVKEVAQEALMRRFARHR